MTATVEPVDELATALPWTEQDAREWWASHALPSPAGARTSARDALSDLTQALTVDLRERHRH